MAQPPTTQGSGGGWGGGGVNYTMNIIEHLIEKGMYEPKRFACHSQQGNM